MMRAASSVSLVRPAIVRWVSRKPWSSSWDSKHAPLSYHTLARHAVVHLPRRDEDEQQEAARRTAALPSIHIQQQQQPSHSFHSSAPSERAPVAIALGLGAISAASFAGAHAIKAYQEWQASLPETPPEEEPKESSSDNARQQQQQQQDKSESASAKQRENIFAKWFSAGVGTKYYEGGFEERMTRREAALILGVRESSSVRRIKEAHRKLLVLNHPDTGGSTYISGKINEAKELLLKGKSKK